MSVTYLPIRDRVRRSVFGLVAALSVSLLFYSPVNAQDSGTLIGVVRSAEHDAVLSSVQLSVEGERARATSNAAGRFRLDGLAPGRLSLVASLPGRETTRMTVDVAPGGTTEVVIRMSEAAYGLDSVVVTAERTLGLGRDVGSVTRLDLTVQEAPVTVNIISSAYMRQRGIASVIEAYNAAPGVTAGNIPGSPATTSIRGFTFGAVSYLMDGIRVTNSDFISRNWDTWRYESVEVLKGPSSVLYGVGVLAGAINLVPKRANFGGDQAEALVSAGTFGRYRAAAGFNRVLSESVAVRADVSHGASNGYVNDTEDEATFVGLGARFRPSEAIQLDVALDYDRDDYGTAYFGQPLIGAEAASDPSDAVSAASGLVLDRALRDMNYDVTDGLMDSESWWLRTRASVAVSDRVDLVNDFSFYSADRRWANAEDFVYDPGTQMLDRYTTKIFHEHSFLQNRAYLNADLRKDGRGHRLSIGVEHGRTDFFTPRRFGTTTAVDMSTPVRGEFPADNATNFSTRVDYQTDLVETAFFAEEAFNVTDGIVLVGGLRYDHIAVSRTIEDLNGGGDSDFDRDFNAPSWRVGAVVDVGPSTQIFSQYSSAVLPVSSFLTLSQSRAGFDLTKGQSIEGGIKTRLVEDRLAFTASVYHMGQDDILTRDPDNPALTVQGGSKSSTGVEFSFYGGVTDALRVEGNLTLLDARFDELFTSGGDNLAGNTPSNVPERVLNANAYYLIPGVPVTIGATLTGIDGFFTDDANTISVSGHTVLGASVSYESPLGTLMVRGRNLADHFYVNWSGYSPTQVYVAEPRSFDVSWSTRF